MKQLHQVLPDEASRQNAEGITARHKWGLPGVKCHGCGETWAQSGVAYPSVDLSDLPTEPEYQRLWPVSLEILEERRQIVAPLLPDKSISPPGTSFGPLVGQMQGGFGDFAWANSWTLLVQPEALEQLRTSGVKLPKAVRAQLTPKKSNVRELFEFELEPRVKLSASSYRSDSVPRCNACGRDPINLARKISVQGSSIPSDIDISRDSLFTTLIFANDRFVEAVKRLNLTGLEFQKVDVELVGTRALR